MNETLKVPELGDGVDSVEVVAVLVSPGDTIEVDQPLIEVETEKASVEVPSTTAGTVAEIHVKTGDSLVTGDPIVTVATETGEDAPPEVDPDTTTPEEPVSVDPDATTPEEPVSVEPEITSEAPSAPPSQEPTPRRPSSEPTARDGHATVPAAPTVRRFAREVGVDLTQVSGSGAGGRISIDDVKAFASRQLSQHGTSAAQAADPPLPDFSTWGQIRREPMTKIRKVTATNMARSWTTVPQVTHHDLADVTELEKLRKQYRARVDEAGGKLTLTAILVKVAASALRAFPTLNASIDVGEQEIVFKDFIHIGVAVDTENGLLVPVIRDADQKNITEIAVELDDLAQRARERKLTPAEMLGASFTISNLGGIGGVGFSPIVNWPEVAILGVSRGSVEPRWIEGEFQPRLMLPLSLSYDHRLVDGAEAARFVRWFADALEEPLLLALEG